MKKFVTFDVAIRDIKTINPMINNIIAFIKTADQDDISEGLSWYPRAYEVIKYYSRMFNKKPEQIAGIISALSPGTNWAQNVVDSENLLRALEAGSDIRKIFVTTYHNRNRSKAHEIWLNNKGESDIFRLLLGTSDNFNKTSHFFMNMLHPQLNSFVTIDRHSFKVALHTLEVPQIAMTEKRYSNMVTAYKQAGKKLGYRGSEIQAITWVMYREKYIDIRGAKPALKLDRFVYSQILFERKRSIYEQQEQIPF
jgi:hypothetical protein